MPCSSSTAWRFPDDVLHEASICLSSLPLAECEGLLGMPTSTKVSEPGGQRGDKWRPLPSEAELDLRALKRPRYGRSGVVLGSSGGEKLLPRCSRHHQCRAPTLTGFDGTVSHSTWRHRRAVTKAHRRRFAHILQLKVPSMCHSV